MGDAEGSADGQVDCAKSGAGEVGEGPLPSDWYKGTCERGSRGCKDGGGDGADHGAMVGALTGSVVRPAAGVAVAVTTGSTERAERGSAVGAGIGISDK